MCEQNRNKKRREIEGFDWFIERIQTRVAFGWLRERSGEKKLHALELSRNQSIIRFDVILQHDWPVKQCLLHIRVFFGGKTKRPCFDLFIYWLIKQITDNYWNHFSRSCENRSDGPRRTVHLTQVKIFSVFAFTVFFFISLRKRSILFTYQGSN